CSLEQRYAPGLEPGSGVRGVGGSSGRATPDAELEPGPEGRTVAAAGRASASCSCLPACAVTYVTVSHALWIPMNTSSSNAPPMTNSACAELRSSMAPAT